MTVHSGFRRATKLVTGLEDTGWEERLQTSGLSKLEEAGGYLTALCSFLRRGRSQSLLFGIQ